MDGKVTMLRHTVATLAYRGCKALRNPPRDFADFRASEGTRTPGQILAHICDLLDWALALANGEHQWQDTKPMTWEEASERFFAGLEAFDARLTAETPLACSAEALFQGPVADALTHIGQISMLRRMAGGPVKGENYFKAAIAAGTVSSQQPAPRVEFD